MIQKFKCPCCGQHFSLMALEWHEQEEGKVPLFFHRFRALGKTFAEKPKQPEPNGPPPLRVARIQFNILSSEDRPILQDDAIALVKRGKLVRKGPSMITFLMTDEFEFMTRGGEVEEAIDKAIKAGARL